MIESSEYFSCDSQTGHFTAVANLECGRNLIQALLKCGVRDFIVSPGSRNTPVLVALEHLCNFYAGDSIWSYTIHRVLDERAAAFFALGIARGKAQPTTLLCTSGSAAANYFPAVIEANYSEVPLVVLTADRPPELLNCGAPQTIDQLNLFGNHARGFLDLGVPERNVDSEEVVPQVSRFLMEHWESVLGPLQINLPFRKPLWTREAEDFVFASIEQPDGQCALPIVGGISEFEASRIAKYLGEIERGCIVVGARCHSLHFSDSAFSEWVAQLATSLGWPVIAEPASGVRFQDYYPPVISMADGIMRSQKMAEHLSPEFILRFGKFPTSKAVGQWLATHCGVETFYVSESPRVQDPLGNVHTSFLASPSQFCADIMGHLAAGRGNAAWLSTWEAAEMAAHDAVMKACPVKDTPLWEGSISHQLANRLPTQSALHIANSMPIRDMDSFAPTRSGNLVVYSSRGANGIDGTIATALGEAFVEPARPTTLLVGDLATLHDLSGLHLAALFEREGFFNSSFVIVVVDNNGGGIFEHLPVSSNDSIFERAFVTPQGTNIESTISGLGLSCARVFTDAEFQASLEGAYARMGVTVIIAEVERTHSVRKRQQVWRAMASSAENSLFGKEELS